MAGLADVRYVLRGLRRRPGWTVAAVATLALGIGANATMLALVDRLLVRPPPHVRDPRRVVRLSLDVAEPGGGSSQFTMVTTSFPVFADLARSARSYSAIAAVATQSMVWGTGADAHSVSVAKVSGSYFRLLGPRPVLGRFFGDSEDQPPGGERVAVISYARWRHETDQVGSGFRLPETIRLDGDAYQVIGVAPPDFSGDEFEPVDVWVPLHAGMGPGTWQDTRGMRLVRILGRLANGVSATAAAQESSIIVADAEPRARVVVSSLAPGLRGRPEASTEGRVAIWVAAMAVVVLLIAIVNVTNLMLLRAAGRRRDAAVHIAIGAAPRHLARTPVLESLVVATLGGFAAVFVAAWGSEAIRATLLPDLARPDALVSYRLIAVTLSVTVLAAFGTGLVPVWRAMHTAPLDHLRAGGGAVARARSAAPTALLVAQGSLCMVLLVAAGLFVVSLHRVRNQDFGFTSAGVLLAELRFASTMNGPHQDEAYRQAEARLRGLPGVRLASVVQAVPFLGHNVPPIAVPGREDFPDERQQAPFLTAATPAYFGVLGMRVERGRNFTDSDRAGSPLVVIVNRAMADGLWPSENPLGKCIRVGFVPGEMPTGIHASAALPCREVVGVVNNARPRSIREESGQARMQYYVPFGQLPATPFESTPPSIWGILIQTASPGQAGAVQRTLQSFSSVVSLADVRPLQDILDRQMRPWLLGATLFSAFGALALALAAIGLYGVRAYAVSQRTREIGIRIALGAGMPKVMRMILWDGVRVTSIGIAVGSIAALAIGRLLEPLLFQTPAVNPPIHAVIGVTLIVVALIASAVPAWRAARVDPNVALRSE